MGPMDPLGKLCLPARKMYARPWTLLEVKREPPVSI